MRMRVCFKGFFFLHRAKAWRRYHTGITCIYLLIDIELLTYHSLHSWSLLYIGKSPYLFPTIPQQNGTQHGVYIWNILCDLSAHFKCKSCIIMVLPSLYTHNKIRYCFARSTGFRPFSLITSSWVRILAMTRLNRKLFGANNFVYIHIYLHSLSYNAKK